MNFSHKHFSKGFSIIELLVTIAVLAIIVLVLGEVFIKQSEVYSTESAAADVLNEHSKSIEMFANDVRTAATVEESKDGNITDTDTLVLKLYSIDAQGVPLATYDYIIYSLNPSTHLVRQVIANASSARKSITTTTDNYVSSFSLTYSTPLPKNSDSVTISLTSSKEVRGKTKTQSDTLEVKLRNK